MCDVVRSYTATKERGEVGGGDLILQLNLILMGLVAVFKRQPFFVSGSIVHFTGSEGHKFSKKM